MAKSPRPVPATVLPAEHEQHDAHNPPADAETIETPAPEQPAPAVAPVAAAEPAPIEPHLVHDVPDPRAAIPDVHFVEIDLPLAQSTGYTPTSLTISLTGAQAKTLADLAEGLRKMGMTVRHAGDALKLLLDHIATP